MEGVISLGLSCLSSELGAVFLDLALEVGSGVNL